MTRLLTPLLIAAALLALLVARPVAASAKDGDGEVRIAGVCGRGVTSELRLKSEDQGIELRFKLRHSRAGSAWRIVLVQERRIAWKGTVKATGSSGSFELRRMLRDLPGADAVSVRALSPRGLVCRAAATIVES